MTTEVEVAVRFAFVTAFRYRQTSEAVYRRGRLTTFRAETDDNGEPYRVRSRPAGDGLAVTGVAGTVEVPGTAMTNNDFWARRVLDRPRIVMAKTGAYARPEPLGRTETVVRVGGEDVRATRYRSRIADDVVSLFYDDRDRCVRLVLEVKGEVLDYRLET